MNIPTDRKTLKIGIDCRFWGVNAGIGRYIRNLIFHLQKLDKRNKYFLFLKKQDFEKVNLNNNFTKIVADFKWYSISEQIGMTWVLSKNNLDLVHFPHFNMPFFWPGKFIVTIHDLTHQYFQMRRVTTHNPFIYKIKRISYKIIFKKAVNYSAKILVPSNYVKNLLKKEWDINPQKITVTYEGVEDKFLSIEKKLNLKSSIIKMSNVLNNFDIEQPYLFYVGNAHPHKNVEGLIKAFLLLQKKYQNLKLVLSGEDQNFWPRIKREFQYPGIIYTGFVNEEELIVLYKNAACFVMSSFEEGFGIPILEAMACSTPIAASNVASLPEIGGSAVNYFDPFNIEDIVEKIEHILRDKKFQKELIEKGRKRVRLFSWEKMAQQTLECYRLCA